MAVTVDVLGDGTGLNGDFVLLHAMDDATGNDVDAAGNCFSALGQTNTAIKVQGTASVPYQAKSVTNQFGFAGNYQTTNAFNGSNKHLYAWVRSLDPFQIEGYNTDEGMIIRASDASNGATPYKQWEVGGQDTRRATVEGFIRLCVDMERTADESAGTLVHTNFDGIYVGGTMVSGSGQNTFFVDAFHAGSFFRVYAGTAVAKGTSAEIAAVTDVIEAGIFKDIGGVYFILSGLKFGDNGTGSSYFKDTGGVWLFEDQNVAPDHYAIIVEGNATGTNSFELGNTTGTGKNTLGTGGKTMVAGQEAFHIDMTNANVDTAIMAGCNLLNAGTVDGTIDITNGNAKFVSNLASECGVITLDNSPLVVNNTIVDSVVASTDAAIDLGTTKPTTDTFANNNQSGCNAHGLRVSGVSTTGDTWNMDNIVLADNTTADFLVDYPAQTSGKVTINLLNGSAANSTTQVAVTGGIALADVVLVSNPVTLQFTVKDSDTSAVIAGAAATIPVLSGGPFPYQASVTITQTGGTATVTHTAHGFSIGHKTLIDGANEAGYNGIKTILSVPTANSYTYAVAAATASPATGTITSTAILIDGVTNASGIISDTRTYPSNQPFGGTNCIIQKGTGAPPNIYKARPVSGTVDKDTGLTLNVLLTKD